MGLEPSEIPPKSELLWITVDIWKYNPTHTTPQISNKYQTAENEYRRSNAKPGFLDDLVHAASIS